jgi:hypothetical protein
MAKPMTAKATRATGVAMRRRAAFGCDDYGMVLPDGRPARGHPANEDLFAGTPVRGGHFVTCIPPWLALPLVAREDDSDQREDHAKL